jgi:NadR type nicotinamide-nucleotide adenylyltransferase
MTRKIAIVGPESTGKSDLSIELAGIFKTFYVPEVARKYLQNLNRNYVEADLLQIAKLQMEAEDQYEKSADKILLCDTNLTVIKIWSIVKYGRCDSWIIEQDQHRNYDFTLLTNVDLPWVDDPLREHPNPCMRNHLMNLYLNEIKSKQTPFDVVSGSGEYRIQCALQILSSNNFLIPSLDIK